MNTSSINQLSIDAQTVAKDLHNHASKKQLNSDLMKMLSELKQLMESGKNPFSAFDDSEVFTLTNAMYAMAIIGQLLADDNTTIIQNEMGIQADLVGPLSQAWTQYFQGVLNGDVKAIKDAKGNQQIDEKNAKFSTDNSLNSQASTGFGNISSQGSSQISSGTSNFQNLMQLLNTVVTSLIGSESQNWVL